MAAAMGKDGFISLDGTTTAPAFIDSWTLNADIGTAEITAFNDASRAFGSTIRGWNVSCAGTLDKSDAKQDAVLDMFASTSALSTVTLRLYDRSANYWSGSAYPTNVSVGSNVADKVTITYNFQGTGNLSYT